ncbi:hypothetical protein PAPYR_6013 [Paratrimastix pyriformis]|uniref:Uncharacterized protein n=1 Tax=Paratrimastix pyriformis TaxID=342808 RepID=A0ABQ8UJC8_9EUKA|nr:hypothetical protein PAPYR_6013 [Paratrimastix pyriformis]
MSSLTETSGSLQWLSNAIKKHESGLARRVRHHYERDAGYLRADICSLVDFIAEHAPKEFSEHVSSYLFPMLSSFTIDVLDRYSEINSDPHYRKHPRSLFHPKRCLTHRHQIMPSRLQRWCNIPGIVSPFLHHHRSTLLHVNGTLVPPQLVPVAPLEMTSEPLYSGDPGPPQPRARRRRRR